MTKGNGQVGCHCSSHMCCPLKVMGMEFGPQMQQIHEEAVGNSSAARISARELLKEINEWEGKEKGEVEPSFPTALSCSGRLMTLSY